MNSTNFSYLRSVKKFDPSVIKGANRMTDKPAIEKVREALEAVNRIVDVLCLLDTQGVEEGSIADKVKQALAALEAEKPAEEVTNPYGWQKAFRAQYNIPDTARPLSNREEQLADACKLGWNLAISANSQYTESYHAEQCKACRKDRQPLPEAPR